jgi:hypothetical protein
MRLSLTPDDERLVRGLIEVSKRNIGASDIINSYLAGFDERAAESALSLSHRLGPDAAYSRTFAAISGNGDQSLMEEYGLLNAEKLSPGDYLSDPYVRKVGFEPASAGSWNLRKRSYLPYQGFLMDEVRGDERDRFKEISPMGYFAEPFPYMAADKDGKVWMSAIPHEINSMREPIKKAHGHVLAFGLGMGYYPYMASLNGNVEDVTVVESDPDCIALFKEAILPRLNPGKPIIVKEGDAYAFAQTLKPGDYDSVFSDIHATPEDGLYSYIKMERIAKDRRAGIDYWIERSILALLRRAVLVAIEEELDGYQDYVDPEGPIGDEDALIDRLHFILRDKRIASYGDAIALLSDKGLRGLAI